MSLKNCLHDSDLPPPQAPGLVPQNLEKMYRLDFTTGMMDQDDLNESYREDVVNCATIVKRIAFALLILGTMFLLSLIWGH